MMRPYKVRVTIFNGTTEEVLDKRDFDVGLHGDLPGYPQIFDQLASDEVDIPFAQMVVKSHNKLLGLLNEVQVMVTEVSAIFHSGNYADLLELQGRVKGHTGLIAAIIQEARMLDMGHIFKKKDPWGT